MMLTMIVFNKQ